MEEKTVRIPTMSCGHCLATIRREVGEISGVESITGDPATKIVTFRWKAPATWEAIARMLVEIGYPSEGEASP